MCFIRDFVRDKGNSRKIDFKEMKYSKEAYHCLVSKNAWFGFFQRTGAKICVKLHMSFWDVLEGWTTSDSWVILEKSQQIALDELKQSEKRISKLTLCSLRQRFS